MKVIAALLLTLLLPLFPVSSSPCDNPILFVTQIPVPQDFATITSTFGNQRATMDSVSRGGDLYIRYPNGSLKNLTQAAGYGNSGLQGASSIAVRDPSVSWDGTKALFSMVIGAPTQQYQVANYYWQIYEITGLGQSDTPVITKVANQPSTYNNIMPAYGSAGRIIFVTDRPRNGAAHLYPQLDEYESQDTNTGVWSLNPSTAELTILDHSPSGAFDPNVDSYGRVIYTRWDHLQRDQQNLPSQPGFQAFTWSSEDSNASTTNAYVEIFPEPRDSDEPDYSPAVNLHTLNHFFPWMINQNGTEHETLNHIGRQELLEYLEKSFTADSALKEFYGQYSAPNPNTKITNFFHTEESFSTPGLYLGTNAPEFGTHASGQLVSLTGQPGLSADDMLLTYLTHPDTSFATNSPNSNHSGLYRTPFQCVNGALLASHTPETREDSNIGSGTAPQSRYDFRIKLLTKPGSYYIASSNLTSGISKSVSWWSPDQLVSYSGNLWELQPVEVITRTEPSAHGSEIQAPERMVLEDLGVTETELRNYLIENDLALVVGRDVTTRDDLDKQQPFNLRVTGTETKTVNGAGLVYNVSDLQFLIGEQVRGYGTMDGRRVLPKLLNDLTFYNPTISPRAEAAIPIASDGSWAAFLPAKRALTWQLTDAQGEAVVRERYWVTFAAGEVRVCASCHGANKLDQAGNLPPQNEPQALRTLLEYFKGLPPGGESFGISLSPGGKIKAKAAQGISKPVAINIKGLKPSTFGAEIKLKFRVNGKDCGGSGVNLTLDSDGDGSTSTKSLPIGSNIKSISVQIYQNEVQRAAKSFKVAARKGSLGKHNKLCRALNGM